MDLLEQGKLDSIISKLNLDSFKKQVRIKAQGRGRKPVVVDNPYMMQLQEMQGLNHLPVWLDDVLTGAGRTQGNTVISARLLLSMLCNMPLITTGEIKDYLNRKRLALTGSSVYSDSYCSALRCAAASAIKSISYHLSRGKTFSDRGYNLPYTTGEINGYKLMVSSDALIDTETGEIITPYTTGEIDLN